MSSSDAATHGGNPDEGAIVILGAGPAGLACAYQLLASGVKRPVVVLDRAKVPGGAGASFRWKNHTLDHGPTRSTRAATSRSGWSASSSRTSRACSSTARRR